MFGTEIFSFLQVILIDLVLSGDNAVIIGTLAAGLAVGLRNKAIMWGMGLAVAMRILLSLGVVYVLKIPGIMAIGGLLLFYVAYKMYKDLTDDGELNDSTETKQPKTFMAAIGAIAMADFSMSLDNVLGVAGAAAGHIPSLVTGLVLSVALMGFAAKWISTLIDKHKWIAWLGLGLIVFIAGRMTIEGIPAVIALF